MSDNRLLSDVRIWYRDAPIGVGFVLDDKHIMTCAHVVADALGDRKLAYQPKPSNGESIEVDFLAVPGGPERRRVRATIELWYPIGETAPADVAVIKIIDGRIPAKAQPVRVGSQLAIGDELHAFGVGIDLPNGRILRGQYMGELADGRLQMKALTEDEAVRPGCSGAAVWHLNHGYIIGMVAQQQQDLSARIIPISHLQEVFPFNIVAKNDSNKSINENILAYPQYSDAIEFQNALNDLVSRTGSNFLVSVEGISGSGKTYLVANFLRSTASNSWSRVFWYDVAAGDTIDSVIQMIDGLQTYSGWSQKAKAKALLAFLDKSNTLLVCDDCHLADPDSLSALIDSASEKNGPCRMICISQSRVRSSVFTREISRYVPTMLSIDQIHTFVHHKTKTDLSESEYEQLHAATDGLPFAVALFCVLLSEFGYTVTSLLSGSALGHERLSQWCRSATAHLESEQRSFLFALALVDGPIDHDLIEVVAGASGNTNFRSYFDRIVEWHLLRRQAGSFWVMHGLLAKYCKSQVQPNVKRAISVGIAEMYRLRGQAAKEDSTKVINFALACRYLISAEKIDEAEILLQYIAPVAKRSGAFSTLKNLLELIAKHFTPDLLPTWSAYHYVHALLVTGETTKAKEYLQTVRLKSKKLQPELRLSMQRLLIEILIEQGRLQELQPVIDFADRLIMSHKIPHVVMQQYLGTRFQAMLQLGNLKEAETAVNSSLKLSPQGKDRRAIGILNMQLSQLSEAEGKMREALSFATTALEEFMSVSDQRGMLWAEAQIGLTEIGCGNAVIGVNRIISSTKKLTQFELSPQGLQTILKTALKHCQSEDEQKYIQKLLSSSHH